MLIESLLKPEVKGWFTEACHSELQASQIYQYLSNQMQRLGYFGAQKFFKNESLDERTHYQKLADFMNDLGDVAPLPMIEAVVNPIASIGDALDLAYTIEKDLLYQYQEFYKNSEELGDCITANFIRDFIVIQVSSVGEYGDLISRYQKNMSDVFEFDEFLEEKVA